jgi:hypothetical protein
MKRSADKRNDEAGMVTGKEMASLAMRFRAPHGIFSPLDAGSGGCGLRGEIGAG